MRSVTGGSLAGSGAA